MYCLLLVVNQQEVREFCEFDSEKRACYAIRTFLRSCIMNKSELVRSMSAKSGSTVKDAEKLLNAFVEVVTEAVSKGDDVTLIGFGTFSVAKTAARIGRNFKTGQNITIPASKHVKFRAGKALKEVK